MNDIERADWWGKERIQLDLFTPIEKECYDIVKSNCEKLVAKHLEILWPKTSQQ